MRSEPRGLGVRRAALVSALPLVVLAASCTQTANITDVYTALDADGARRRNEFFTDTKEIHCVIEGGFGRDGVTVEAVIRQVQRYDFDQGQFVDADRVVGQADDSPKSSKTPVKIDLALKKVPDDPKVPYFPGRYVCEVRMDGEPAGSATFNIQFPPCPTAFITAGTPCLGFYESGRQCPAYGASSTENATCSCELGGWNCQ